MFTLEKEPLNKNLLLLFENGFKPISFNIFEKMRFFWLQEKSKNKTNIRYLQDTTNDTIDASDTTNIEETTTIEDSTNIEEETNIINTRNISDITNILNNEKWVDLDYLLTYVTRPWYNNLTNIMHNSVDHFMNNAKLVQISVFIVVIVIVILCYCIIWKSYEEQLTLLLKRSFDLINLIPEEIKYLIVS